LLLDNPITLSATPVTRPPPPAAAAATGKGAWHMCGDV
jgi:hypothetical protein